MADRQLEDEIFNLNDEQGDSSQPTQPAPEPTAAPRDRSFDDRSLSEAIKNQLITSRQSAAPLPSEPVPSPVPAASVPAQPQPSELEQLRQQVAGLLEESRKQRERAQRAEQQAKPQQPPGQRIFEDPEGWEGELKQTFEQKLWQHNVDVDCKIARQQYGAETFDTAWQAFIQNCDGGRDQPTFLRVVNSSSPGEEVIKWHQENSDLRKLRESGGTLTNYEQTLRERLLSDPDFLSQALAKAGAQPQAQQPVAETRDRLPNGQFAPRHEVRLPTPTSRIAGARSAGNEDNEDGSEDAIFSSARTR